MPLWHATMGKTTAPVPPSSPVLPADVALQFHQLLRQHTVVAAKELAKLTQTTDRPFQDYTVLGPCVVPGETVPSTWSPVGTMLLAHIKADHNDANFMIKRWPIQAWLDPARAAAPGITEGGLAWISLPLSPEDPGVLDRWPAFAAEPFRVHWERAAQVALTLLASRPPGEHIPALGNYGTSVLEQWWGESIQLALSNHHMKTVPRDQVATWMDQMGALGVTWVESGMDLVKVLPYLQEWCATLAIDHQRAFAQMATAQMFATCQVAKVEHLRTPWVDWFTHCPGPSLPLDHWSLMNLSRHADPQIKQLPAQWLAYHREHELSQRPVSHARPRRRS